MKKLLIMLFVLLVLLGCAKKDELALGEYKERNYINDNFNLDVEIPEEFSYLTPEELINVNEDFVSNSENPEQAKYRNIIMRVEHLDGTNLVAFVDAEPEVAKNKEREAHQFLDFLSSQDIEYEHEISEVDVNGVDYLQLDLGLPFDEVQRNLITVRNNKLVNIQINYKTHNYETAESLLALYE